MPVADSRELGMDDSPSVLAKVESVNKIEPGVPIMKTHRLVGVGVSDLRTETLDSLSISARTGASCLVFDAWAMVSDSPRASTSSSLALGAIRTASSASGWNTDELNLRSKKERNSATRWTRSRPSDVDTNLPRREFEPGSDFYQHNNN